jgi:hypothetical protein
MSVALHSKQAQESSVLIDTTVQEKNITYPTDFLSFGTLFNMAEVTNAKAAVFNLFNIGSVL